MSLAAGIFLCCVAVSAVVLGQSYSFKNYTTHEGLVQTEITDIDQDRSGNIWIATKGGISIFDGRRFTNFDDHDLLQNLYINALLCDASGIMWVATQNGLLKYENGFTTFFKPDPRPVNQISCITTNTRNQLLFVCNHTIYEIKEKSRVERYAVNPSIEKDIALVAFDREDNLWIVTNTFNIYKVTGNTALQICTPFTLAHKKEGLRFIKLLGTEGPTPYFITNFGTFCVKNDSLHSFSQQYRQFHSTRVGNATYILEDENATVWAGGTVGLSKLSTFVSKRFTKESGFCDNSVSCIFLDRERNLWVGTTYNGVYRLSNESLFQLKPSNESIDLKHVSAIQPLSANTTLISTWGKGLYLWNQDTIFAIPLPKYIRYISAMASTGNNTYIGWFGKGIWKMNNSTQQLTAEMEMAKDEAVYSILKVSGHLLIQTLYNTCYLTDTNLKIVASAKLPEDGWLTVLEDKIYQLSSYGQINRIDNNLKVIQENVFPEVKSRITEMVSYQGNTLIGTFGQGLFVYNQKGKLIRRIDKKNGLTTNIITSLLVDSNRLFVGSNMGLIKMSLPDFIHIKVFKEEQGMFNWECRPEGLKKLPDGSIFIATTNGPYIYYPHLDKTSRYTSAVLTIKSVNYGKNLIYRAAVSAVNPVYRLAENIAYSDNQVAITLNGVSQRNPYGITYHYQLKGVDSNWTATANPVMTFRNLQPGTYLFTAYLHVENFISKPVTIQFAVSTPLSGKFWFQVLLVALLSFACWLLLTIGNRIYQKYIQTRMISKIESRVVLKQGLTTQSIHFAQSIYKELYSCNSSLNHRDKEAFTTLFFKDLNKRIELLWKKDQLSLGEFHWYFDELLLQNSFNAKIYHQLSIDHTPIPMHIAFHMLQVFSLYLFNGLNQKDAAVFSLDSEYKSNGRILIRFYAVTRENPAARTSSYHFLKDAITMQLMEGVTMDVIENLEYGNTIIAEVPINTAEA